MSYFKQLGIKTAVRKPSANIRSSIPTPYGNDTIILIAKIVPSKLVISSLIDV
jgi:hypothetical protein